ncbi:MAG: DUF3800 domain-containing protein [Firmicutes bacterium]|nr:DUF3800 domain-containing protein [Bacillota bacterium]
MTDYYLFLDETIPNSSFPYFSLAGFFISKVDYETKLIPKMNEIKDKIFGSREIILHEVELRNAQDGLYKKMRQRETRESFWSSLSRVFEDVPVYTIGVGIDVTEFNNLYQDCNVNDDYSISMQIIMENFVHFLEKNDGYGTVFVEARDGVQNQRLQNKYHTLKANGTLFIDKNAHQDRLGTISFPLKTDNNIGLQLADFVPNPMARYVGSKTQKTPNVFSEIENKLYCGGVKSTNRFGFKRIP